MVFRYTFGKDKQNEYGEIVKKNIFSHNRYMLFSNSKPIYYNGRMIKKGHISIISTCLKYIKCILKFIISSFIAALFSQTSLIRDIIKYLM
jgi:hypothetical protein